MTVVWDGAFGRGCSGWTQDSGHKGLPEMPSLCLNTGHKGLPETDSGQKGMSEMPPLCLNRPKEGGRVKRGPDHHQSRGTTVSVDYTAIPRRPDSLSDYGPRWISGDSG